MVRFFLIRRYISRLLSDSGPHFLELKKLYSFHITPSSTVIFLYKVMLLTPIISMQSFLHLLNIWSITMWSSERKSLNFLNCLGFLTIWSSLTALCVKLDNFFPFSFFFNSYKIHLGNETILKLRNAFFEPPSPACQDSVRFWH